MDRIKKREKNISKNGKFKYSSKHIRAHEQLLKNKNKNKTN